MAISVDSYPLTKDQKSRIKSIVSLTEKIESIAYRRQERDDILIGAYDSGLTPSQISVLTDIPRSTIYGVLARRGK